jgi:molecular chaperone GrpE
VSREDSDRTTAEEHERVVIRDNRKIDPETGQVRKRRDTEPVGDAAGTANGAAPAAPAAQTDEADENAQLLAERTADLQRLQAEYANYRRRAERDRQAAGEQAIGRTLGEFLPVIDDLDRAAAHGDLDSGPLKAIADKLQGVFDKLGLEAFGEQGDRFDPALHEAVAHAESDDVTAPTCTTVMRKGYRFKDRLLRPAMVAVTDPATPTAATGEESAMPEPEAEQPVEETGVAAAAENAATQTSGDETAQSNPAGTTGATAATESDDEAE